MQTQKVNQEDVSAWMTGIVEVPLSVEQRLKNVEETEHAKRKLLSQPRESLAGWVSLLPVESPPEFSVFSRNESALFLLAVGSGTCQSSVYFITALSQVHVCSWQSKQSLT